MKLKFVEQQYQIDAVNSIVDIFEGCQYKDSMFTVDISEGKSRAVEGEGITYNIGHSNEKCLTISDLQMLENVRNIQERNFIKKTTDLEGKNFTIEMETGTGKTYVYTNTILELNQKYGFTKFIIVVPSIAIKEGVHKSLQITEEHFKLKYNNLVYNYFVYDSNKLNRIMQFATSSNIEIMIINIDAFRKSFVDDPEAETKANIIHRPSDKLSGNKPIDLIKNTKPIVIIDEPQSVDNTPKSKEAIRGLNPLCTIRYSATHKTLYNLMYRLTPVDAADQHLVKGIEVSSVHSDETSAKPYVKLLGVDNKNGFKAKLEIYYRNKADGSVEKKTVTAKLNSDLWDLSNEVDYYHANGYVVADMNAERGEEDILFSNGTYLRIGEAVGQVDDEALKRAQIRETIDIHLSKELKYIGKGIKVLSLFFIDKVANYRLYDQADERGKYAVWFEEEYERLINGKYKRLKELYPQICFDAKSVHTGYFSEDKKGRLVDTNGTTQSDDTTYELIMKKKEELLDLKNPIRFIFSHSALKEGWDNPNVFQVCTLIETKDTFTKRQKIGRGLRIAVNQNGERVLDHKYNVLSVVANESYKLFAETLQKEFVENGYKFGIIDSISFTGLSAKINDFDEKELTQEESEQIFKKLKDDGYIGSNNKVTEKFYVDVKENKFEIQPEFAVFTNKVINVVKNLSRTYEIKDKNQKVKISRNDKVINSEIFNEMWNKIKHKSIYSIHLPIDEMKEKAIEYIAGMPVVEPEKIRRERVKLKLEKAGVKVQDQSLKSGDVADVNEFETINYPDFIRRLQDATQLLRGTIIEIIAKSGRLEEFYVNPEVFIKQTSQLINKAKKEYLLNGIQYHKLDNEYYMVEEIFDDTELYGYKDKNIIDVSEPDKNPLDYVLFDSIIERQFAEACDQDDEVKLYAKLPIKFEIDTPFGKYRPDWMVVIQREGEEHRLYFIAETKGTTDVSQLKVSETNKIFCGRKHFEVIDTEIKYEVVDKLLTLKNQC